jgi:DNA-binding FadR family transcriptional regulator
LREMRAIFQAINNGDSKAARKAAEVHVKNASAAARATFDANKAKAAGARRAG